MSLPSQGNVEDLFQGLQNATSLKDIKIDSNPNLGGSLEDNLLLEPGICSLVEVRVLFHAQSFVITKCLIFLFNSMQNGIQYFAFGDTIITGTLPSCLFGGNSTLQDLTGSLSAISGEIPDSITDAQSLRTLQISGVGVKSVMM